MKKSVIESIKDIQANPEKAQRYLALLLTSGQISEQQVRDFFAKRVLNSKHNVVFGTK